MTDGERYYALYVSLTKRDPGYDAVGYHFRRFAKRHTERDLKILIRWVLRRLKKGEVTPSALHAGRLLDPERAADHLCDAKAYIAKVRRPRKTDRTKTAQTPPGTTTEVLTDQEAKDAAEALRAWRAKHNDKFPD